MSENGGVPKSGRRDPAADLRLRPERPPVTRLSRKALMGLAAIAVILISGALVWGLSHGRKKPTGETEVYNTENKPTPDGLTALPRDYSGLSRSNPPPIAPGVPVLGPPLPGDLGRPIHNAQVPAPGSGEPPVDAEQQRVVQETEAARTSRLFATTNARERPGVTASVPYLEKAEIDALLAAPDRSTLQGARDHALLLFLYNTGARVSEATGVRIGDVDWHSKSVRITGKGSKQRRCPLWGETIEQLRCLAGERPDDASLFVNCRGEPYTRYGVHTLVERYVAKLRAVNPAPQGKQGDRVKKFVTN